MELSRWMEIYREIEREFGFSRGREYMARDYLSSVIGERYVPPQELGTLLSGKVYVAGNSPELEREIELITHSWPIIAADNAAVVLSEYGIEPFLVMTDLDGELRRLEELGSFFAVHAHGDNMHLLPHARDFERMFGTTQVEPVHNVFNFGGFTDGDRAVCFAVHFGAEVHLVGFDFARPRKVPGKNAVLKRKKLIWARRIIENLQEHGAKIVWEKLKS